MSQPVRLVLLEQANFNGLIFNTISYTTKEFKTPTAKTKKNHNPRPEKILPLFCVQPSGEANATGTPTTNKNETPINAKRVN